MKRRYWVSWWSGYYEDEGCTKPPFQIWISGQRDRPNLGLSDEMYEHLKAVTNDDDYSDFVQTYSRSDYSICAVIDAETELDVLAALKIYFPDREPRFCVEHPMDFTPGDRFPNFENKTSLEEKND